MKNKNRIIIIVLMCIFLSGVCAIISGCSLFSSPALSFKNKLKNSTEYAIEMKYDMEGAPTVFIDSYFKDGKYAYDYSLIKYEGKPLPLVYRELFVEDEHFSIQEIRTQNSGITIGTYNVDNIKNSPESDANFLYKYTMDITKGSLITMFKKSETVVVDDVECLKYNFTYEKQDLTYWFNKESKMLRRFSVVSTEMTATIDYLLYSFENVPDDRFKRPDTTFGYIKAPFDISIKLK